MPSRNVLLQEYRMVSISFYGGVGEIGGNKILLADKDTRILLDFGNGVHFAVVHTYSPKTLSLGDFSASSITYFPRSLTSRPGQMFGSSGFVIERLIARQFYKKLELTFDYTRDYGLIRYVEEARTAVRAGRS